MKKGQRIPISENSNYPGKYDSWNEEFTGEVVLKKGTKLYHHSSLYPIDAFHPSVTCFSYNYEHMTGYIYCLIVKKNIVGWEFDCDEVRLPLELYMEGGMFENAIEIFYIGKGEREKGSIKINHDV